MTVPEQRSTRYALACGPSPAKLSTGCQISNVRPSYSRAAAPSSTVPAGTSTPSSRSSASAVCVSGACVARSTCPGWPVPTPSNSASTGSQWCIRTVTDVSSAGSSVGSVVTNTTGRGSAPRAAATRSPAGIRTAPRSVPVRVNRTSAQAAVGACRVTPSRFRNETYAFSGNWFNR
ncbi:hypothetical protein GUI43_06356 [Micromonospora noduli]|nr:hypothetical protein GUI43_06356 [Micromonospora noduli]